jgi:hypothetical protein
MSQLLSKPPGSYPQSRFQCSRSSEQCSCTEMYPNRDFSSLRV